LKGFGYILAIAFWLGFLATGQAQRSRGSANEAPLTRILFVFDGSKSMFARWESGQKIDVAQRLMTTMLDSLRQVENANFELALRVYGHQKPVPPQDCNDTKLEVAFDKNNFGRIKSTLRSIRPKGTTPIARSLSRAAYDFPACTNCRNIIILITDGVEACDEDPCAASRQLQKKGIALKPFVIGIGLDPNFRESLQCVGNYYDAANEKTFKNVLGIVVSQALNNTTAQVNLLDGNGLPTETNVPITFYNATSGQVAEQFIHALNYKGKPDTIKLDPLVNYNMTVHSKPEAHLEDITISGGTHNIIGLDLPRGFLNLSMPGRNNYDNLQAVVRPSHQAQILHLQDFNSTEKYLEGRYTVEMLTLPRIVMEDIAIEAGKTTSLGIPPPGVVNFQSSAPGYGSILVEKENKVKWVIDLNPNKGRQSFTLQPGNYRVVFRVKSSQNSLFSVSEKFSITSGTATIVKLN
jgi:Ca-activated chloride channel family protein